MFVQLNQTVARAALGATGAALCATVCLFGAAAPAHAATPYGVAPTATVSYADLDVTRAEGRATLESRLRRAARQVCTTGTVTLAQRDAANRCVKANVANGMQTVMTRTQVATS